MGKFLNFLFFGGMDPFSEPDKAGYDKKDEDEDKDEEEKPKKKIKSTKHLS